MHAYVLSWVRIVALFQCKVVVALFVEAKEGGEPLRLDDKVRRHQN